jgi:hypothetical protein
MLTDKFVRETVGQILGKDIASVRDWSVVQDIIKLLLEHDYILEVNRSYDNDYIISATRWIDDDDAGLQDYAFASNKELTKCFMELLVKANVK